MSMNSPIDHDEAYLQVSTIKTKVKEAIDESTSISGDEKELAHKAIDLVALLCEVAINNNHLLAICALKR